MLDNIEYIPPRTIKKILSGFLWEGLPESNSMALTFDDGPDPEITPMILDTLSQHNIKGTFFVTGENALKYPELVKEIAAGNNIVGNHSFSHQRMFFMKNEEIREEIMKTQDIISSCTGSAPRYFRPPYGMIGYSCAKIVKKIGLKTVIWTILTGDYHDDSTDSIVERVKPFIRGGSIAVFHDTQKGGGRALPEIITRINDIAEEKGLKLDSLDKLIFHNKK